MDENLVFWIYFLYFWVSHGISHAHPLSNKPKYVKRHQIIWKGGTGTVLPQQSCKVGPQSRGSAAGKLAFLGKPRELPTKIRLEVENLIFQFRSHILSVGSHLLLLFLEFVQLQFLLLGCGWPENGACWNMKNVGFIPGPRLESHKECLMSTINCWPTSCSLQSKSWWLGWIPIRIKHTHVELSKQRGRIPQNYHFNRKTCGKPWKTHLSNDDSIKHICWTFHINMTPNTIGGFLKGGYFLNHPCYFRIVHEINHPATGVAPTRNSHRGLSDLRRIVPFQILKFQAQGVSTNWDTPIAVQ